MKVYLVHNVYYDYGERDGGSLLLGIYSSMENAISARDNFVAAELAECVSMDYPAQQTMDADSNPVIEKFFNDELTEDNTYTIEEWDVQ